MCKLIYVYFRTSFFFLLTVCVDVREARLYNAKEDNTKCVHKK